MGWNCVHCTFLNANDSAANCGACSAIRVLQCPTCKGEIKYGKRLNVQGKTYHPDCFCCTGCKKPLPSRFQVVNGGNYHPECSPKPKATTKTTTTSRVGNSPAKTTTKFSNGDQSQNENCSRNGNVKVNSNESSGRVKGGGWNCPSCTCFNANDASPTCKACNSIRIMKCPGCNGEIKYGPRVNLDGKSYHPDCFCCAACHKKFETSKFQVKDGEYYHHECYKPLFHPRCDVCEDYIPYQPGTQKISFKVMPFGDLKYCAEHENSCDRCCSCQRVEPTVPGREFHSLSDGRKVCHDCCDYLVLGSKEAKGLVSEVWDYMRSIGIDLPEIPVYLVEAPVLHEHCKNIDTLMQGNKPVHGHVTRGICLSEVSQVQHMVRSGKNAVPRVASIEKTRSVNAILVLHGLPRDLSASILAHEATHAFIKLSDDFPDNIPAKVEEGMCQLISYLFLKYKHKMERKQSKKRSYQGQLRKFYTHQLKKDTSPVYGDGFREAYEAYKRVDSLQVMFDAIRHHASFP